MDSADLDSLSLRLAIELQLEDLQGLTSSRKGKHPEGQFPDRDLAVDAYKAELELLHQANSDAALCQSIADAVRLDGGAIEQFARHEHQAAEDRRHALRLHSGGTISGNRERQHRSPKALQSSSASPQVDDELFEKMLALNQRIIPGESSQWAASRPQTKTSCTCCMDEHSSHDVVQLPCEHIYCRACIVQLFTDVLTDESLFPPRCCKQPIPIDTAKVLLPPQLLGQFKAKEMEYSTPNRTYCHVPTCSTFIPEQFTRHDQGTCPRCKSTTCLVCKGPPHQGKDCPQDPATQQVLALAKEKGWSRCRSCHRLVELMHGCNHISRSIKSSRSLLVTNHGHAACRCRAQFCYECAAPWKTCQCKQWDEARLVLRTEQLINRGHRGVANMTERRRRLLRQQQAEHLRENHECQHGVWTSISGEHTCETCHDTLPEFIYECVACRVQVCRRCRLNRT
ncbi:hypothetical protein HJFPF1_07323 [Paramyrothecium foliicola]|nr:hypothetical protein HJFPF1_07323 [Paramyrothecium foliicola]